MRVLLVAEQLRRSVPGGIGTYTRGLLQGLRAMGADSPEVTLLASRPPADSTDPIAGPGVELVTSQLPGPVLVRAWDRGLSPVPPDHDVVHAPSLALPPSRDTPLVVTVHDLAWREMPEAFPPRGRRWHEAAIQRALTRARRLVVPSTRTADLLVAAGASPSLVEVVEEGCDHLPPADLAGTDALLRGLGVAAGYLLAVGTLEPRKNLPRLLAAYERARSELPEPWPLVVVGPRGWGESVGRPPHGVVLAGPVEGALLAGLYRRARCLAYVPLLEGFGLPPVEAMRECSPVVASPIPSTQGAALEVDPLDVDAIAEALVRASSDERLRAELVTAGLLRAAELTWEGCARRHVELWSAVA